MAHYFENDENLKSNETEKTVIINNTKLKFITDNGVFSKKGLDFGTRTLLESISRVDGKVLDFGCGYGPIGIYLKKTFDCSVTMLDINKRSVSLALKNASLNNVDVNIIESDMYEQIKDKYNYIISNPPIRIGKEKLYKILFDAKKYLEKNGKLIIVVNKNQGAKSLIKDLEKEYKVEVITKNKGFYIISALNC